MKRGLVAVVVAVAVLVATVVVGLAWDRDPETTSTLPDVTLPAFSGDGRTDLTTLRGPLVVNLFASWCDPCARELPIYQDFYERHGATVDVLGVDFQDPQRDAAAELVASTGVEFPLLNDVAGELSATPPFPVVRALPFVAFVDEEGAVVHVEFVEVESLTELEDLAEQHLDVTL